MGCGVAALLVLLLFGGFVAYVRRHPEALTDWMMKRVESSYGTDVRPAERERLHAAYAGFRTRLLERRVPRADLDRLRTILSTVGMGSISRDQVRELTELFEGGAASRPIPEGPGAPHPTPSPVTP